MRMLLGHCGSCTSDCWSGSQQARFVRGGAHCYINGTLGYSRLPDVTLWIYTGEAKTRPVEAASGPPDQELSVVREDDSCVTERVKLLGRKFQKDTDSLLLFASPKSASSVLLHAFGLNYAGPVPGTFNGLCTDSDGNITTCKSFGKLFKTHSWPIANDFMTRYSTENSVTFVLAPIRHVLGRAVSQFFQERQIAAEVCEANRDSSCGQKALLNRPAKELLAEFWEKWSKPGTHG